jgi:HAD superfamily hydrolase (TIGR01490 family)
MKKVAIFDIDGTIFRSAFVVELLEVMVEHGWFPPKAKQFYKKEEQAWRDRKGQYEDYIEAVVLSFMTHLRGVEFKDFDVAAKMVVARHKNRVYRYTRDLVKRLKKRGYFLLAISQSPKGVLDSFCSYLGFDKVYGRFYELGPSDRFTGKITDLHLIVNKANIVKRALKKEGLTLEGSIGVGDTDGDISFLELVETPICFNPNSILYRHAKRNDWKIVVERKDVIYEL